MKDAAAHALIAELFGPNAKRCPVTEERLLRDELERMNHRHARARAPIVARLTRLACDGGATVITLPGVRRADPA